MTDFDTTTGAAGKEFFVKQPAEIHGVLLSTSDRSFFSELALIPLAVEFVRKPSG